MKPTADNEGRLENGLWYVISDGKATITKYSGALTSVEIPNEINGYRVTSIAGFAF